jgi:hypothetical protein
LGNTITFHRQFFEGEMLPVLVGKQKAETGEYNETGIKRNVEGLK